MLHGVEGNSWLHVLHVLVSRCRYCTKPTPFSFLTPTSHRVSVWSLPDPGDLVTRRRRGRSRTHSSPITCPPARFASELSTRRYWFRFSSTISIRFVINGVNVRRYQALFVSGYNCWRGLLGLFRPVEVGKLTSVWCVSAQVWKWSIPVPTQVADDYCKGAFQAHPLLPRSRTISYLKRPFHVTPQTSL